jgi:hypothetical protein
MRNGRIAVLAVGVLAAGAVALPALAGQTVKSTITGEGHYHGVIDEQSVEGSVESRKHACEVDRRVKLFFKGEGVNGDLAGRDRSDRHGVWKIPVSGSHFYYATVVRSKEDTAGTTFVCGGDRTKRIDTH